MGEDPRPQLPPLLDGPAEVVAEDDHAADLPGRDRAGEGLGQLPAPEPEDPGRGAAAVVLPTALLQIMLLLIRPGGTVPDRVPGAGE